MEYIYKLLDDKTTDILQKEKSISLSRPFLAFKSEGRGFKVFRTMMDRLKESSNLELLYTDKQLLKETHNWICGYYDSLPLDLKDEYDYYGIKSDLQIAMTIYFQTYCGYFTSQDLGDESTREKYIENNKSLFHGKDKYVKLSIEENNLNKLFWTSNNSDYNFICDVQQEDIVTFGSIRGTLHIHEIEYSATKDLKKPFIAFNGTDNRRISSLLNYVNDKYFFQNEKRLMFRIPSYRANESVVGFNCCYPSFHFESFEQQMICLIGSICLEAIKYPDYVYLTINNYEIKDL